VFLERRASLVESDFQKLDDSHEDLFETLQVPVLIDDGMDNSRKEDLVCLVGEEVHEVVHLVDLFEVRHVVLAPLR